MSIRVRLTLAFIAVILLANLILFAVMERYVRRMLVQEVQTRVASDLAGARKIYDDEVDKLALFLRAAAIRSPAVFTGKTETYDELCDLLQILLAEGQMDMLTLVDIRGQVICRAHNANVSADDLSGNPLVARVLQTQRPARGTLMIPAESLQREGAALAERAHFEILDTPGARPTTQKTQSDGMVIAAAAPLFSTENPDRMIAVLYGANLLNRRFEIVDTVRNRAFQQQLYAGKPIGTATIFLGDLRISTNVLNRDGSRAVGTRLSEAVYEHVLQRGLVWNGPAFVVNDRYITAYEPIRDPDERIIGALYVGMLEAPFVRPQETVFYVFLIAVLATSAVSLVLLFLVSRRILRPIDRIATMAERVMAGDLTARVGIRPSGEMGLLCRVIDDMADAVAARENELKTATSRQIGQSEKLASIGRLAAGIAHEINNPLTGVLTFTALMREKENMDDQDREDLDLVMRETTRVRDIVRGLLDFARESPHQRRLLQLNAVVRRTMRLLQAQKEFHHIQIREQLDEGIPWVIGDENQLQQVLLNLALNACEAMSGGGTLTVTTTASGGQVVVKVADTGCGIAAEDLNKIFDPFFTTKPAGKGTGLGLSVSYGIVQQHGGTIEVDSAPGAGSVFTVSLPAAPPDAMDDEAPA